MIKSNVRVTATYQITNTSPDILSCDVVAAGGSITLTAKVSPQPGAPGPNQCCVVRDVRDPTSTNTDQVVFTPGGGATVDGLASKVLISEPGTAVEIRHDGAGVWHTVGQPS